MTTESVNYAALENAAGQARAAVAADETEIRIKPPPEDAIIIVPVRNVVLFPGVILPVSMRREGSVAAAQEAARSERQIGLLLQRDPAVDAPRPDDLHWVGTVANVMRYLTTPDGVHHVVCQGETRFRVLEFLEGWPFMVARIQRIEEVEPKSTEIEARALHLKERATEALQYLPQAPAELANAVRGMSSPAQLADLISGVMDLSPEQKQELLETFDLATRLDRIIAHLAHRIEVLKISHEIDQKTKEAMEERSREVMLREQMKAIQKQLGETDERAEEAAELEKAIAEARMPEEVEKQARKELKRLERMHEGAGEYSMVRTYLDWLIELPWSKLSGDRIDIAEARAILDEDHYGLDKIKRRILEFLAVRKLNPAGKSPILCFVGPPGVGKTSLGQSIARAMGRKFVRVSLGGTHDEAEIRGHRRTYIGALPGNIVQAIKKGGTANPVMMLDEIDKLGAGGFHGDPSSALLEVLDPEQNATFRDNYLGVPFDLSKVMFIATANMLETVPGPLRDRMEVIQLPGYTEEEKLQIARRYLVKRQLEANGLKREQCELDDAALRSIIADYTREAGVRNLEREIGSVFRHVAMKIAEGSVQSVRIAPEDLPPILGPRKFENEIAMRVSVPGVATGLAWTPVGGDILFIEASKVPGSGKLILTGQLGDVMKESAQAAMSLAKARSAALGISADALEKSDIHVHVPAGATPKDGPSAGVAMYVALVSLLAGKPVKGNVAMTGEISLRGLVLPVGGIKEKVLAALRAGIATVLLPARNRKELEEIPAEAREKLRFVFVEHVDEAVREAIDPALAQAEANAA
jgi:ATP-dependent Lon protease